MLAAFHYYNKIIELIKRKKGMLYFIVKEISVHVHLTLALVYGGMVHYSRNMENI